MTNNLKTLGELREAIVMAFRNFDGHMIQRAFDGMFTRAGKCVAAAGNEMSNE